MRRVHPVTIVINTLILANCQEAEVRGEEIVDCQAEAGTET